MDPVSLLIGAMILSGFLTKWIQDGRTDREYARKGMVSPRHQARLKRLEAAGRPASPKERGPLRNLLSEYWADAVLDLAERHRQKRTARGPYVYDPDKRSFVQRCTTRWQRGRGWDMAKATGQWLWTGQTGSQAGGKDATPDPVTEPEPPVVRECQPQDGAEVEPQPASPVPACPICQGSGLGYCSRCGAMPSDARDRRYTDASGRVMEWDGHTWGPVCPVCDKAMREYDPQRYLACGECGLRATEIGRKQPTVTPSDGRVRDINLARTYAVYEDEGRNIADPRVRDAGLRVDPEVQLARQTRAEMPTAVASMFGRCAHVTVSNDLISSGCDHAPCVDAEHGHPAGNPYCHDHSRGSAAVAPRPSMNPKGTSMEASNYETAVAALDQLAAATRDLADHTAGALGSVNQAADHVSEVDEARRRVAEAIALVQEQLAAKGVAASSVAQVQAAMEQLHASDLSAALDHAEGMKSSLTGAQAAAAEASGGVQAAHNEVVATYGDIAATMAAHGTDGSFVDGGGGSAGALNLPQSDTGGSYEQRTDGGYDFVPFGGGDRVPVGRTGSQG